jgi:glycosyltransferase involved in cell wall biosynthesis
LFGIKPERISVAYLATDLPSEALAKEGNRHGDYILYAAQAFPRRHLRETVQAFEKISKEFPNLKLVAIGPDKYRPPLSIHNNLIIRRDHVSDSELATLYAHAKVFVYVSDREAFGLPPLEALAYGVPSVLADKPVSRELFGDHAFYAATANATGIAVAITDALTNDAKRSAIRSAAPAILARFTWPRFTDRWLEIVKTIENC